MHRRLHSFLALVALVCLAVFGAGSVSHAAAPGENEKKAREFYEEGRRLFDKELYAAAIENFKKAHALYQHPVNLYNIARGYEKLGDADNCVKGYNEYIDFYRRKNNGKDPDDILDARASIAKCQLLQKPEITVISDPEGASIYVDDKTKLLGQTPFTLRLDPGKYKLFLNLDKHAPFEQELEVRAGQPVTLRFKLEKFQRVGQVRVKSNVRGASLFIDGRNVGLTPYTDLISLDEGAHQIAVTKDDYLPYNKEVKVVVGETVELTSHLYLRDAPATWKGYVGWTAISLGAVGIVGGVLAGTQADQYFSDTKDFDDWAQLQTIGYVTGGVLIGAGITLVVLEALDDTLVKGEDELDPVADMQKKSPKVVPFVSAGGLVGADVRF